MKALVIEKPKQALIKEVDIPGLGEHDVLIKVKYAGICGTDISIYTGESSFVEDGLIKYPIRIGHEWSGVVEKTGSAVTRFRKGDHVIGDNSVSCGKCDACRQGRYVDCPNMMSVGTINTWDGCFAQYMLMPERHLYKLPKEVDLENAALIEPMSIAQAGMNKCDIKHDSIVVVIGTGAIGLSAVALAKEKGAKEIILIGRTEIKLDVGKAMGATHTVSIRNENAQGAVSEITFGKGADYIIEASGKIESINLGAELAAKNGKIILLGFYERKLDGLNIDRIVVNEISIQGIMGSFQAVKDAYELIIKTGLDLTQMITRRIRFDEIVDTLKEISIAKKDIKVIVSVD